MNKVVKALAENIDKGSLRKVYECLEPSDKSAVLDYWAAEDFAGKIIERALRLGGRYE